MQISETCQDLQVIIQESEKKDMDKKNDGIDLQSIENLKVQEENEDINKDSTQKVEKQIEKEIQEEQEQSIEEMEESEVEIEDLLGENQDSEIQAENKQAYKFEIDKRDDKNKFMVYTKYGLVKLVQSDLPEKQLQKIEFRKIIK
ncbi:hypothetical protein PPERSA_05388 [Pseudocohnilembus persalinus]|uniref:Uncharacterized protein n=1 Tax=Pseudocohnilembus persalinus TaxID=266149 RepID=A0A0V0R8N4_PSEPJ|nr:hypothetical protein PPERSA_05388 [Pseudocohnilembus persalinus]|eukprot:KRX10568.1 hypothetical protein PPERSA_05388 [Pseudocohnilembus persalinus]